MIAKGIWVSVWKDDFFEQILNPLRLFRDKVITRIDRAVWCLNRIGNYSGGEVVIIKTIGERVDGDRNCFGSIKLVEFNRILMNELPVNRMVYIPGVRGRNMLVNELI